MTPKANQSWEEFLTPEVTRYRLIAASVFIAGFEALKEAITDRLHQFFWIGFDRAGDKYDSRYETEVLKRSRSRIYASLDWLQEKGALDEADLQAFDRVKACRNTLAHELLATVTSEGLPDGFETCFADMATLLKKIEVWWIVNVEIPASGDFDGQEVDEASILPGRLVGLQLLVDIALGDEKSSRLYRDLLFPKTKDGQA